MSASVSDPPFSASVITSRDPGLRMMPGGLRAEAAGWWLDPRRAVDRAFVSHAHSDHFARHRHTVCSAATADILRVRFGIDAETIEPRGWDEEWIENGWALRLLPAGHVLGSAMFHARRLEDGSSFLYTGDCKLRTSLTAEPATIPRCDVLVMETTFALPRYVFPPREEVWANVADFLAAAWEDDATPVLIAYSLGKAQEAVAALAGTGATFHLAPQVAGLMPVFQSRLPHIAWPEIRADKHPRGPRSVLVVPPNAARSVRVRRIKNRRLAALTGWALEPSARFRYQVDEVFPISDHLDHTEAWRLVRESGASRVLTLHGYAREFAAELRANGIEAWSAAGVDQLDFAFSSAEEKPQKVVRTSPGSSPAHARTGSFATWVDACEAAAATASRRGKTEILAAMIRSLPDGEKARAAGFCAGDLRGLGHASASTGWATIRRALMRCTGMNQGEISAISRAQGDAGRTARLVLESAPPTNFSDPPAAWSLADAATALDALAATPGILAREEMLAGYFRTLTPLDASWLVRLLTDGMRTGVREGVVEDALAAAFDADPSAVRRAHQFGGSLAGCARALVDGRIDDVRPRPMVPILPMLASSVTDPAALLDWAGNPENGPGFPLWLEPKLDGIRGQIHKSGDEIAIFSRDRRRIESGFPALAASLRELPGNWILDGEIVAESADGSVEFPELQKHLGRTPGTQRMLFDDPGGTIRFIAFDCLWRDGTALVDTPLARRRAELDALAAAAPGLRVLPVNRVDDSSALDAAVSEASKAGHEGLMAKDPASPYLAGRRGRAWMKLKHKAATLDVVVVRAQQGHGKRAHLLSDYTFAVRDTTDDSLRIIGKAYSGLTDEEIEELTGHFERQTLHRTGRVREVVPDIVLEIAFDRIGPSKRHDSGLALRFPRIKAIRRDKSPADIDTLATARRLAGCPAFPPTPTAG